MKYTVVYRPSAEGKLTDLWIAGPDRDAIATAANEIDAQLARDPMEVGEQRWGNTRILVQRPLAVYYDVDELDWLVTVWAVWRWQ